ncbi:MAG TPA: XRE family transcriptional regulator [Steroidobacteraceae bacterium]|nr:XRE family transcriptional regulator [Steroidobacteraceae bacterium]
MRKSEKQAIQLPPEVTREETIGQRLRALRHKLNATLAGISAKTGVSISALSKVENDQISPSYDILKRICDGLDIGIEDLVSSAEKKLVSGRKTSTRSGEGALFTSGQYNYRAHADEISHKSMVPLEMVIRARAISEFDHWSRHRGEEFVFVLSGRIEIHTEHYAPFRLEAGESAYFDSSMRHLYISLGDEDARVLSVSHDPGGPDEARTADFLNPGARVVNTTSPV